MALTVQQIEDLIEQVGADVAPADLDRESLRKAIEFSGMWYRLGKRSGSTATANKRSKWLRRMKSITAELQEAMRDEENAQWFNIGASATFSTVADEADEIADPIRDKNSISWTALLVALDELHEEVSRQLASRSLNALELSRSPFEYLAGERLPQIFSEHFKRKIGVSRAADTGRAQGPLFRFVRAGVDLLNITHNGKRYQDEAIVKAIRDTKSRPSRRKTSTCGQRS